MGIQSRPGYPFSPQREQLEFILLFQIVQKDGSPKVAFTVPKKITPRSVTIFI